MTLQSGQLIDAGKIALTPLSEIGDLFRLEIVSDNACLFSCINTLLCDGAKSIAEIRRKTAEGIAEDVDRFNDVTLDKPRDEYLSWIQEKDSWGGYIELIVLSRICRCEIVVFDIQTTRQDVYNECSPCNRRIYLCYDGVHYDALAAHRKQSQGYAPSGPSNILGTGTPAMVVVDGSLESRGVPGATATEAQVSFSEATYVNRTQDRVQSLSEVSVDVAKPSAGLVSVFDPNDMKAFNQAQTLTRALHKQRRFTNTAEFRIRCGTCGVNLKGESEARAHAKSTGHIDFREQA